MEFIERKSDTKNANMTNIGKEVPFDEKELKNG